MDGPPDLYERDFVAWTEAQAGRLRAAGAARLNAGVDWEHVAEEIEDLGRSTARELRSRLTTIMEHLLKLRDSPATDPRPGWVRTVVRERLEVGALLKENPSLRPRLPDLLRDAEEIARLSAAAELEARGETLRVGGDDAAWDAERVLGGWFPGGAL